MPFGQLQLLMSLLLPAPLVLVLVLSALPLAKQHCCLLPALQGLVGSLLHRFGLLGVIAPGMLALLLLHFVLPDCGLVSAALALITFRRGTLLVGLLVAEAATFGVVTTAGWPASGILSASWLDRPTAQHCVCFPARMVRAPGAVTAVPPLAAALPASGSNAVRKAGAGILDVKALAELAVDKLLAPRLLHPESCGWCCCWLCTF